MRQQLDSADGSSAAVLNPGTCLTGTSAGELRANLLTLFGDGRGVELDLGEVAEVDAAGLQLLCAARQSATAAGVALSIRAASELLRTAARSTGLSRILGEDEGLPQAG